jgi:predicted MPP superfamily phosphohydrolase
MGTWSRRKWLASAVGAAALPPVYALTEASWIHVESITIPFPELPAAFCGLRILFISDVHHGPFTSIG